MFVVFGVDSKQTHCGEGIFHPEQWCGSLMCFGQKRGLQHSGIRYIWLWIYTHILYMQEEIH